MKKDPVLWLYTKYIVCAWLIVAAVFGVGKLLGLI